MTPSRFRPPPNPPSQGTLGQRPGAPPRPAAASPARVPDQPVKPTDKPPQTASVDTFWAQIYIAGDVDIARQICRERCMNGGLCVTLEAVEYIYMGGMETGVRIGLINYPRFPTTPEALFADAEKLAHALMLGLHQHSFSIVTPEKTVWWSRRVT